MAQVKAPKRDVASKIVTRISANMTGGIKSGDNATGIMKKHASKAIDAVVSEAIKNYSTSRFKVYTYSTMTAAQKAATGMDKLRPGLLTAVIRPGSTFVHNGTNGQIIVRAGKVYHVNADGNGEKDFENIQKAMEDRIAYEYADEKGSATEKRKFLAAYNKSAKNVK